MKERLSNFYKMKKVQIGRHQLLHWGGKTTLPIDATFRCAHVEVECLTPAKWFLKLTKCQALKFAKEIRKYYGEEEEC